jgi:hypothetical protein
MFSDVLNVTSRRGGKRRRVGANVTAPSFLTSTTTLHTTMSETEIATEAVAETSVVVKKDKKMKPARKQVKPGQVEKKEAVQTGKEYSAWFSFCMEAGMLILYSDIWYNKWAGGDREDSYSKSVDIAFGRVYADCAPARPSPRRAARSGATRASRAQTRRG